MITFLVCLALLLAAYFTYGRYLERLVGIDPAAQTPCSRLYDGVDYVPLPRWRIFLIQLLNIAGLGPIFGAVLGAAYGPVAFLWITFGGIFMGAAHDFIAGVISLRHDGASLPETAGVYLGNGMKIVMRLFSAGLMILVGAVFLSQPASLVANRLDIPALEGIAFGGFSWLLLIVLGVILIYYIAATLLPVDKIIGRIYPVFGFALLFMAVGILVVLLFGGEYTIPEFTSFKNCIADAKEFPIVPMLFTTIACGAISGFHATQSPLMARCVRNERECRSVFFGAMISESIIALIWAAVATAFFGGAHALAEALAANGNSAAWAVNIISNTTLGIAGGILALLGVVAAPITSGDTAFRSARLIVADIFRIEQRTQWKRFAIALPLFVAGYLITRVDFTVVWRYFAWTNQTLATIVLWAVVVWLFAAKRNYFVALLPAVFMTFICASFVFVSGQFFGMENRPAAYALAGAATAVVLCFILLKLRRNGRSNP